jgi:hypothetical protein
MAAPAFIPPPRCRYTVRPIPPQPPMVPAPVLADLVCHPQAADTRVRAVTASVTRQTDGGLILSYRLEGELAGLRIPDAATPLPPERLWAHTCFEAFLAQPGAAAYREFNFSPNGQWMRFDFGAYRRRSDGPAGPAPSLEVRRGPDCLELIARLPAALLPPCELVLGLTAVVEHADGSLRYWALRHPPGQPDFHHCDGFALRLAAP